MLLCRCWEWKIQQRCMVTHISPLLRSHMKDEWFILWARTATAAQEQCPFLLFRSQWETKGLAWNMISDGGLRQGRWFHPNFLSVLFGQIIIALEVHYTNEVTLVSHCRLAGIANYFNPPRTRLLSRWFDLSLVNSRLSFSTDRNTQWSIDL